MAWRIEFTPAAGKELSKLDRPVAQRILAFLDSRVRVAEHPRSVGEALGGARLGTYWKYRVGDYRVIAFIMDDRVLISVVRVAHRSAACQDR